MCKQDCFSAERMPVITAETSTENTLSFETEIQFSVRVLSDLWIKDASVYF